METFNTEEMSKEELEKAFIKNVFLNKENRYFLESIKPNYFTKYNMEIKTMIRLYKRDKLDFLSINEHPEKGCLMELLTGDGLYDVIDIEKLYKELVSKHNKNIIFSEVERIKKDLMDKDPEEVLAELEQIRDKTTETIKDIEITEVLRNTLNKMLSNEKDDSLKTYICNLDDLIYNIPRNNYIVVGARPGCGKTALALQIAANNMKKGKKVLYISLEMSSEDLCKRLVCNQGGITIKEVAQYNEGNDTNNSAQKIARAINNITKMKLYIEDKVSEHHQIMSKIKSHIIKNKVDLVIVDYIGLIVPSQKSYSREREIAEISRDLKLITRDYNVPVMCLTQLNRDGADGEPSSASIRESDSLLNDANKVLLLWEDKDDIGQEKGLINCKVAKNREGKNGTVQIYFDKPVQQIKGIIREDSSKTNEKGV